MLSLLLKSTVVATVKNALDPVYDPARVCFVVPSVVQPTAVHDVSDGQDTPSRWLSGPVEGS
jgi:hypothetical protein